MAEPHVGTALVEWKPTKHTQFLTSLHRTSFSETVVFAGAGPRELVFKQGGSGTGAVQWGSGQLLAHFLAREPQLRALHELGWPLPAGDTGDGGAQAIVPAGWAWTGQRVVELGAGLGLVATVVALCGADIVVTDGVDDLIDQLQSNVDLNLGRRPEADDGDSQHDATAQPTACEEIMPGETTRLGAAVAMLLPWGDEECAASVKRRVLDFVDARGNSGASSDALTTVLIVADCVFGSDRRVHKQLVQTINSLGASCVEEGSGCDARPLLLLTHKPRYPSERWFFKRLCRDWEGWLVHFSSADGGIQQHGIDGGESDCDTGHTRPRGGSGGSGPICASLAADAESWWSEGDPFDIRTQFWVLRRRRIPATTDP